MRRVGRAPLLAAALLLAVGLGPAAWAVFSDTATVTAGSSTGAGAFTSGSLGAPGTPSATQADGAAPLTITWTAAAVSGGGTPVAGAPAPTGYDVVRYADATTSTGTVVCTVGAGVTTCTTPPLPTTPAHYGVRARFGAAWTSDSARVLHTDQRGPVVRVTQPAAGLSLGILALQTNVNNACNPAGTTPTAIVCGTAVDTAGVAQVRYRLQRAVLLGGTSCWSGSAWVTGACTQSLAAALSSTAPSATAAWRVPGAPATAYASVAATFTLTVEATDANGRLTTSTTSFSTLL